jgi:hypothetical protein
MYERYTQSARRTIFFASEEARKAGSPYIEPEHLLLAIMRSCKPELNEAFKLKELEDSFRAELAMGQTKPASAHLDIPISNQSKRILAYAAEEAEQLNSRGIDSRHLLLGILREPASIAGRFLASNTVNLGTARKMITTLRGAEIEDAGKLARHIGWASSPKRYYRIRSVAHLMLQVMLFVLIGMERGRSAISGLHLLIISAIWFGVVFAWTALLPYSLIYFTKNHTLSFALTYAYAFISELFAIGWIIPLSIGLYRVTTR